MWCFYLVEICFDLNYSIALLYVYDLLSFIFQGFLQNNGLLRVNDICNPI